MITKGPSSLQLLADDRYTQYITDARCYYFQIRTGLMAFPSFMLSSAFA